MTIDSRHDARHDARHNPRHDVNRIDVNDVGDVLCKTRRCWVSRFTSSVNVVNDVRYPAPLRPYIPLKGIYGLGLAWVVTWVVTWMTYVVNRRCETEVNA